MHKLCIIKLRNNNEKKKMTETSILKTTKINHALIQASCIIIKKNVSNIYINKVCVYIYNIGLI